MAHLPFWAANVDTNTDRVTTFLAAHPGTFFCNACLSIEVPVPKPIKVNQLIRIGDGAAPPAAAVPSGSATISGLNFFTCVP